MDRWILWVAQGFGLGRVPFAPGTFGSLGGLLWFAILLRPRMPWLFVAGTLAGLLVSVWICGAGERILRQTDPGSIVLDEIVAMPVCFLAFVVESWLRQGQLPELDLFFSARTWYGTALVFGLFRLFDIIKPWPVRQSQRCPGGWGVTLDDLLAAVYVAVLTVPAICFLNPAQR